MSLIQDALRRQQEELEGKQPERPAVPSVAGRPAAPGNAPLAVPDSMPAPPRVVPAGNAPVPGAGGPPEEGAAMAEFEPRVKSGKQIAGIIILCLVIVWGGFFLLGLFLKTSAERSFAGLLASRLAQQQQGAVEEAEVEPTESAAPVPWISPAAVSAPAFTGEEEVKEEDSGLKVGEPQLPAIPSPVAWPRLKLSAVFTSGGVGQAGARLNNRLVLLGDKIEGVTLIEIRPDGVKLQSGSATKFLKMGATLR